MSLCDTQYSGCVGMKKYTGWQKNMEERERKYEKIITVVARCKHLVDRPSILCMLKLKIPEKHCIH